MQAVENDTDFDLKYEDKVYKTVIPRNVRLSEAPSHGLPCVVYDKSCLGSRSYFKLAEEFLQGKNSKVESAAWVLQKKKVWAEV